MLNVFFVVAAWQSAALITTTPAAAVTTPPVATAPAARPKPRKKKCDSDDEMGLGSHISMGCPTDEELAKRAVQGERALKQSGVMVAPGAPH